MGLKVKDKIHIANELLGSCMSARIFAEKYNLDIFDGDLEISEAANEYGVYLCETCGWWCEESEMSFDDEPTCSECLGEE